MAPIFAWSISAPHSFPLNHYLSFTLLAAILSATLLFAFRHERASLSTTRALTNPDPEDDEEQAQSTMTCLGVEGPRHLELLEPLPFYEL